MQFHSAAMRSIADRLCVMAPGPAAHLPVAPARARATLPLLLPLLLLGTLLNTACTYVRGDPSVLVTSTPAGGAILVDGADIGQTTPSLIELGGFAGSNHAITVRKRGFDDETRQVYHYTTGYTSAWIQGAMEPTLWTLPLWWTLGDWVMPFAVRWRYVPHELHVKLYKEGEGPRSAAPVAEAAGETGAR